jgi:hypothetical protein
MLTLYVSGTLRVSKVGQWQHQGAAAKKCGRTKKKIKKIKKP